MIETRNIVLVEVYVDAGEVGVCLSTVFWPCEDDCDQAGWWADFHAGLNAAVRRAWEPNFIWRQTDTTVYNLTPNYVNMAKAAALASRPMDDPDRWTCLVGPHDTLCPALIGLRLPEVN